MIDWSTIDTVLLDMDGTLLDLNFDNHFWLEHLPLRYAERFELSPDQAKAHLFPMMEAKQGSLQWYCLDFWSEQLDMDIVALKREVQHLIQVHPHVLEFLDVCHAHGIRRVLVTNAHHGSLDLKMELTPLGGYLDRTVSSHDIGMPKEHVGFWDQLQHIEPFNPARTVFVDDSEPVLRSAAHYGIAHVIGVAKPDSQRPTKTFGGFREIQDFSDIMPVLER